MIKASRELAQTAYFTATCSLIITNFCIKFSANKVACFCIYLACKWTGLRIPTSNEGREWFQYVNPEITLKQLEDISEEYLSIYNKCPLRIKRKLGFESKTLEEEQKKEHLKHPVKSNTQPKPPHQVSNVHSTTTVTTKESTEVKSYKDHVEVKKQVTSTMTVNTQQSNIAHPPQKPPSSVPSQLRPPQQKPQQQSQPGQQAPHRVSSTKNGSHENHNGNHHRDNQGIQIHALNHIHHSQSKLNSITNTEMPQETGSKRISTGGVNGGIAQQQMSGSQTAVSVKRASEDTGAVPPSTKMPKLISEKS